MRAEFAFLQSLINGFAELERCRQKPHEALVSICAPCARSTAAPGSGHGAGHAPDEAVDSVRHWSALHAAGELARHVENVAQQGVSCVCLLVVVAPMCFVQMSEQYPPNTPIRVMMTAKELLPSLDSKLLSELDVVDGSTLFVTKALGGAGVADEGDGGMLDSLKTWGARLRFGKKKDDSSEDMSISGPIGAPTKVSTNAVK